MPATECKKSGRAHTPIVSKKQQKFFGAELARKREGKSTQTDMSDAELSRHLKESKGKSFPERINDRIKESYRMKKG